MTWRDWSARRSTWSGDARRRLSRFHCTGGRAASGTRRAEEIAGANLRGTISGIDDAQNLDDGRVFVTSIKTHDVKDPESLKRAINSDMNDLFNKSRNLMYGYDAHGNYREIHPDTVAGRGLLVGIPFNHERWLKTISDDLRWISESGESIVRVVPIRNWRSKK